MAGGCWQRRAYSCSMGESEFRIIGTLNPPPLSHDIFEFPDLARKHTRLLESLTFSNICSFSFAAGGGGGGEGAVAM